MKSFYVITIDLCHKGDKEFKECYAGFNNGDNRWPCWVNTIDEAKKFKTSKEAKCYILDPFNRAEYIENIIFFSNDKIKIESLKILKIRSEKIENLFSSLHINIEITKNMTLEEVAYYCKINHCDRCKFSIKANNGIHHCSFIDKVPSQWSNQKDWEGGCYGRRKDI